MTALTTILTSSIFIAMILLAPETSINKTAHGDIPAAPVAQMALAKETEHTSDNQ